MIDINLIRENPTLVKENMKKKFQEAPQGVSDTVSGKHMSFPPSLSMNSVYTDAPGYGVSAGVVRRIVQQQGLAHPPEGGALTPVGAEHRHGGQRIGLIRVVQGHQVVVSRVYGRGRR